MNLTLQPSDAAKALLLASLRAGTFRGLGGVGSGNFGHAGRPGEIGGSTTSGILDAIHKADGGFTYNPITGHSPTEGFALSLHKEREQVLDEINLVRLAQYAKDNEDLLSQTDNYLGGWHNPEDGKFYLDVSTVVKSATEAERLGREARQLAYFDLSKGQSVPIEHYHAKAASAYYRGRLEESTHTRRSHRISPQDDRAGANASRSGRSAQGVRGLGGQGSGNFGHQGRPGERGGSGDASSQGVFSHIEKGITFYHGTSSEAVKDIKKEGLIPSKGKGGDAWWRVAHGSEFSPDSPDPMMHALIGSRKASVYLAEDYQVAEKFAEVAKQINPNSDPVVLKVHIPSNVIENLTTDEGYTDFMGRPAGGWRFKGKIEPSWIEGRVTPNGIKALEDGGKTIYVVVLTDGTPVKVAASKDNTPLHHAADKQESAMSVAVRYAFAKGRAVVATRNPEVIARAVRKALLDVLPGTLLKTMTVGGETALKVIGPKLKAAGGAGSGNFGHGGRPGEVGGSSADTMAQERIKKLNEKRVLDLVGDKGSVTLYHGTSSQALDAIKKEGIRPLGSKGADSTVVDTQQMPEWVIGTRRASVFTTMKLNVAEDYANIAKGVHQADDAVVLRIKIPAEAAKASLHYDERSAPYFRSWRYSGTIPPEWVTRRVKGKFKALEESGVELYLVFLVRAESRALAGPVNIRFDNTNPTAAQWAKDHATELANDLSATTRDRVKAALEDLFNGDATLDDVRDAVGDDTRADIIARTESMMAVNEGQRQGWDQAVDAGLLDENAKRTWIATFGCCDICDELDGTETTLDGEYPDPGGDGPPAHPNCLLGGSLVLPGSRIAGVSKRWFDGDVVVIRMSKNRELTCTPNHPVLTSRGWIAAGILNIGDDVICDGRGQWRTIGGGNHQEMPAFIQDIADTVFQSSKVPTSPVPTSPEDFHGDGGGSEVAIIWANSQLRDGLDISFVEPVLQKSFIRRYLTSGLFDDSPIAQFAEIGLSSTSSVMSSGDLIGAGGHIHTGPFHSLRLGLVSEDDSTFNQTSGDEGAASVELSRQLINGDACEVFIDKVVNVNIFPFRGHVYNLETEDGWYAANGIITQNCRCTEGILG